MNKRGKVRYFSTLSLLVLVMSVIFVINHPTFNLAGNVVLEDNQIKEEFVFVPEKEYTKEDAFQALLEANQIIDDFESSNELPSFYVNDVLTDAKRAFGGDDLFNIRRDKSLASDQIDLEFFEDILNLLENSPSDELQIQNFEEVVKNTELIRFKTSQALEILDSITITESKESNLKEDGINTEVGLEFLSDAKIAFQEERYNEAEALLSEANLRLDEAVTEHKRVKGLISLGKNFVQKYWWQTLIVLIILALLAKPVVKRVRISRARKKLLRLKKELKASQKMIVKAQKDCFQFKTISVKTYKLRSERYNERISEIKSEIPVVRAIISGKKVKKKVKKKGVIEIKK